MEHKINNAPWFLSQPKHTKKVQTINIKKLNQEAKAKNKPTKLSKKSNHQSNLIIFS
jgi:hypothetical protein